MLKRSLTGLGAVAAMVASTALVTAPAHAAVEPPALDIVRPASPLIQMPTQYPTQPVLDVFPDLPTDASIARGVMPYDEIAPFLNTLMATSDRVSSQVVGKSAQGRDIYLVTVTAPETPEQVVQQAQWRQKVKFQPTEAAADSALQAGYKVPIWYNGNIHGNEWEGTDATLNYIEDLATATDAETLDLIAKNRLYFTVTNNPDGRALGQRGTANGYDPNRDFITGATAETAVVRDLASIIQPTYFIDLHGYTNVLQVEPCGPPHGENYEYDLFVPHAYATALEIEKNVVAANVPGNTYYNPQTGGTTTTNTGFINIPFRDQRSGWDDWPPIFAPQYVAYQGAITNTVELPLGRSGDQPARAKINIEVAEIVIDTVSDYVQEHRASLLSNQIEIFRRGIAGEPSVVIPPDIAPEDLAPGVPTEWTTIWDEADVYNADFPRAYVIPTDGTQRSVSDAQTLVQQLLVHGIEVDKTTAPFTVGDVTYPAGSYYVDMHQPVRGLANVLLDDGSDISTRVPDMYDISAWSLSLLWGADVLSVGDTTDPAPTTALEPVSAAPLTGSVPAAGTYLTFEPRGVADYQAINEILGEGVALSQVADGTVVLGPDAASYAAATAAAQLYGVDFVASDGLLLDAGSTPLSPVTVGYVSNSDDRDMLTKAGFTDLVPVTAATLNSGAATLADVDVLFVGATFTIGTTQTTARAAVTGYLAAGKPVVGRGTAAATFLNTFGVTTVTSTTGTSGSNGIMRVDTPADGVLGDYPQDTAFGYPFTWYTGLGTNAVVEQTYAAANPFVAGHWASSTGRSQADAAGKVSAFSAVGPTGTKAFVFGTSPSFRTHPVGAISDVARAVHWAAPDGAAVPLKPDTKPITTLVAPTTAGPFPALNLQVASVDDRGLNRIVANIYKDGVLVKSTQSPMNGAKSGTHTATVTLPDGKYSMKYNSSDLTGKVSNTGVYEFTIDATKPTATIKTESNFTVKTGETYDLISFKLYDAGKIDKVTLNGKVKDLTDNAWSDVNFVKPPTFGAVQGLNTLVVFDVAGNTSIYTFTLN